MAELKDHDHSYEVCQSYTFARRYPKLIGRIKSGIGNDRGWTIPGGPYSPLQIGTFVAAFVILVWTRAIWAHFGPVNLALYIGIPLGLAFVVRHLQIENRPPYRFLIGFVKYVVWNNRGRRNGRRVGEPHPHTVRMRTLVRVVHPEIYSAPAAERREAAA
ncbi:MAG: TcpE family conjugal transfer membrane protein [Streptosporangiales bacterium]